MTRDEIVSAIQRHLGFRTDLQTQIIDQLKIEQIALEEGTELPWFLVSEMAQATTSTSDQRLAVPIDFLREVDTGTLWRYDSSLSDPWVELFKDDLDFLRENLIGSGPPTHYALLNGYFWLFPQPDLAYTMKMQYYKKEPTFSTNIENAWSKYVPKLLIGRAGLEIAADINNQIAMQRFALMAQTSFTDMMHKTVARDLANRELMIGD